MSRTRLRGSAVCLFDARNSATLRGRLGSRPLAAVTDGVASGPSVASMLNRLVRNCHLTRCKIQLIVIHVYSLVGSPSDFDGDPGNLESREAFAPAGSGPVSRRSAAIVRRRGTVLSSLSCRIKKRHFFPECVARCRDEGADFLRPAIREVARKRCY